VPLTPHSSPTPQPPKPTTSPRSVVIVQGPTLSGRSGSTRSRQSCSSKSYPSLESYVYHPPFPHHRHHRVLVVADIPFRSPSPRSTGSRGRHGFHNTGSWSDDAMAILGSVSAAGGDGGVLGASVRGCVSYLFHPLSKRKEDERGDESKLTFRSLPSSFSFSLQQPVCDPRQASDDHAKGYSAGP